MPKCKKCNASIGLLKSIRDNGNCDPCLVKSIVEEKGMDHGNKEKQSQMNESGALSRLIKVLGAMILGSLATFLTMIAIVKGAGIGGGGLFYLILFIVATGLSYRAVGYIIAIHPIVKVIVGILAIGLIVVFVFHWEKLGAEDPWTVLAIVAIFIGLTFWITGIKEKPPQVGDKSEEPGFRQNASQTVRSSSPPLFTPTNLPGDCTQIIDEVIRDYIPNKWIRLAGSIPPKMEKNARESCGVPAEEPVLVLVDCTVFGSAKNCFLLTPESFFCHNGKGTITPGKIRIPYAEFPSRAFVAHGFLKQVNLDKNEYLDVAGIGLTKNNVVAILQKIKVRLSGRVEKNEAPGTSR